MLGIQDYWMAGLAFVLHLLASFCYADAAGMPRRPAGGRTGRMLGAAVVVALALASAEVILRLSSLPQAAIVAEIEAALFSLVPLICGVACALRMANSRHPMARTPGSAAVLTITLLFATLAGALIAPPVAGWPSTPDYLPYSAALIYVLVLVAMMVLPRGGVPRWRSFAATLALGMGVASAQVFRLWQWRPLPVATPSPTLGGLVLGLALDALALVGLLLVVRRLVDSEAETRLAQLADLRAASNGLSNQLQALAEEKRVALSRADLRCEQLLESAGAGSLEWDPDSGEVHLDGGWASMLGYRQQNDLPRRWSDPWLRLCHEHDLPQAQDLFRELLAGERDELSCDLRMRTARDTWHWVRVHARTVEWQPNGRPKRVLGTQVDINALKSAEHTLLSERSLFSSGPVVILTFDAAPPHRLRRFSDSFQEARAALDGPSPLGQPLGAFLHPDVGAGVAELAERAARRPGGSAQREVRLARSDGTWPWYLLHVGAERPDGGELVRAYLIDIDRLKEAELHAAERNQALQDVVHKMDQTQSFMKILQQLTELLQLSDSEAESQQIIARGGSQLFPRWSGALTFADSEGRMEVGACWGRPFTREHSEEVDCWAVRRGRLHQSIADAPDSLSPMCGHFGVPGLSPEIRHTICAPLLMSYDRPGGLHLITCEAMSEEELASAAWGAETLADTLKLSLANLRLRTSLRNQAVRDGMTDLYNRRYFDEMLRRELSRSQRTGEGLILAIVDIDEFKRFNDTFGHEAGDKVIKAVAEQLRGFVRAYDIACRVGGEELAILMPRAHIDEACLRLDQLRQEIGTCAVMHSGAQLPAISVSIGVADMDSGMPEELLRRADMALYAAKHGGKNRVKRWEAELEDAFGRAEVASTAVPEFRSAAG